MSMKLIVTNFGFFLCIVCFVVSCESKTDEPQNPTKPNIVFILADDLGYNDISCLGSRFYETPHIDKIAQRGMSFTNGYAACQVCSPSRASILNGKFPARHGITDWIGAPAGEKWRGHKRYTKLLPPDYNRQLNHDDVVLPEVLRENGYSTFFAGKWHLGNEGSYPQDHGFDVNQGGYEKGGPYSGGFFSPFENPQMKDFPDELGMSLPEKLAKETNQFIESHQDKPFLAYLSFYAVHAPIQTTKTNWEKYRGKAISQGLEAKGFAMERRLPARQQQDNPVYAGLIEHMDDAVGQVLDKLDELGLADNTIVVFTSDNGGVVSGDNYSTNLSPLRGGKGYQWEGGIKVPYLMYVPWLDQGGKKNKTRVSGVDFFPTLLDLSGLDLRPELHEDGISLKPLLEGKAFEERALIWHYPHYGNQGGDPSSIIIKGDWKLIQYHEDNSKELYNLLTDVSETENVGQQHPDIVDQLSAELDQRLSELGSNFPTRDPLFSQDSFDMKYVQFSTTKMAQLEALRDAMLSEDWEPNEDWWGSRVSD